MSGFRDKVCPVCGKSFTPHSGIQITCSEICKLERRREMNRKKRGIKVVEKTCPVCGMVFKTAHKRQRQCGKESCARELYRREALIKYHEEGYQPQFNIRQDIDWNLAPDDDPWPGIIARCRGPIREAELCPLG